jgi:hypothetical protein
MSARCSLDGPEKVPPGTAFRSPPSTGADRVQGLEPGPGDAGPCAAIEARCTHRGRGGEGEYSMGLGNGIPDAGSGLAVSPCRLESQVILDTSVPRDGRPLQRSPAKLHGWGVGTLNCERSFAERATFQFGGRCLPQAPVGLDGVEGVARMLDLADLRGQLGSLESV